MFVKLARWLKIEVLHGYTLGAEELCNLLRSGLSKLSKLSGKRTCVLALKELQGYEIDQSLFEV